MNSKALIVGYGVIGKKHFKIIKKLKIFKEIKICSKHYQKNTNNISFSEISKYNPNYVIIANESSKHFDTLKNIDKILSNSFIYIEKPITIKQINFISVNNNKIFVGYNFRFHPIIRFLKKNIKIFFPKNKNIIVDIRCNSFMPDWRKRTENRKFNSELRSKSGGILFELSHELDYSSYLFGNLTNTVAVSKKVSNLKINSDDYFTGIFKSKFCENINITLSYFDKIKNRSIKIYNSECSVYADLINNFVYISRNNKLTKKVFYFDRDKTFFEYHKSILANKNLDELCDIQNGLKVVKLINNTYLNASKSL